MSKILIALIMLVSMSTHAQGVRADKQVLCFPIKTLLKDLRTKYKEEPMIVGKTSGVDKVVTAFYINLETGSYTVVEMDDEAGCVISIGTEVHYRLPKSGPTT
jgi:hypothetical protein